MYKRLLGAVCVMFLGTATAHADVTIDYGHVMTDNDGDGYHALNCGWDGNPCRTRDGQISNDPLSALAVWEKDVDDRNPAVKTACGADGYMAGSYMCNDTYSSCPGMAEETAAGV